MATSYTSIPNGDIDPDSPITTGLMTLLRDNPIAITEGASGAPSVARAALEAGTKTWVLLQETDASNDSSIDFTSVIDSTYDEYIFLVSGLVAATGGASLRARFSNDNGSTFKSGATDYRTGGTYYTYILIADNIHSTSSIGGVSGELRLIDPSNASKDVKLRSIAHQWDASGIEKIATRSGIFSASLVVNAIRLIMSSGNIYSGNFKLYGIMK